jgi:hypothetical protein
MTKLMRFALIAGATVLTLVLAAPAMAAFSPRFEVLSANKRSGSGGAVTLRVVISKDDDAVFRVQFYVPQGYGAELGQVPGTQMGTVSAQVNARAISPDAIVPVTGTVAAADPTPFRTNPSALGCTGGRSTFSAVLLLTVSAAGQTLMVPVYVFPVATPPFSPGYILELAVCFANPNIPAAQGGAALGIKLVDASITLTSAFVNPVAPGNYVWRSEWIAWGAAGPNLASFTEAQATDSLPAQLTSSAKYNAKNGKITISGALTENSAGVGGVPVRVKLGTKAGNVAAIGTVRTGANGKYSITKKLPKRFLAIAGGSEKVDAADRQTKRKRAHFNATATVPTRTTTCLATLSAETHPCSAATKGGYAIATRTTSIPVG